MGEKPARINVEGAPDQIHAPRRLAGLGRQQAQKMQHAPIPGIAAQKLQIGQFGLARPALLMQREGLFQCHAGQA